MAMAEKRVFSELPPCWKPENTLGARLHEMGSGRSTNESRVKKRSDHRQQAGIQGLLIHAKERKYSCSLRLSHSLTRRKVKLTQQKARRTWTLLLLYFLAGYFHILPAFHFYAAINSKCPVLFWFHTTLTSSKKVTLLFSVENVSVNPFKRCAVF